MREKAKQLECWTRKQLTAERVLHPVMRIYIKRRCGGRGLVSVQECCAAELRSIDFYLPNSEEELLKVVKRLGKLGKNKIGSKNNCKSKIDREKIDELRSMKLHEQFRRDTDDKKTEKLRCWLKNENSKQERESLLSAAQEQVLNFKAVRKSYHKDVSNKYRLCRTHIENVLRIVSGCDTLAQKDYKRRHDQVCLKIH